MTGVFQLANLSGARSRTESLSSTPCCTAHKSPPNIVWICADDYTPDMCGAYGNRVVRTPSLERLASKGLRFDRAYCTCPLSTPSRQSFFTGRYPRSIGVTLSPTALPDDEVTLPALLQRHGYETAAFGKTHFYCPRRHEYNVCVDYPEYEQWLMERHRPHSFDGPVLGPWRPFGDPTRVWLNADVLPYGARDEDMFGTFLSRRAAEFLTQPQHRPFFAYVSYYETHSPYWFPVEFRGRHRAASFRPPEVLPADFARLPQVFRELTPADRQGIAAAYATSAEFMDKNVGIVLDALDRSPHADNTLVIFTSDHGYLLGQHGRFEKHCCFEPAIRAALLMRLPGTIVPGRSTDALVQLMDLFPTILDLCGVEIPSNTQGRSLTALLRGETDRHRDRLFIEYADNEEAMVRVGKMKLIYSSGERRRRDGYADGSPAGRPDIQLFDLDSDPHELINLGGRNDQAHHIQNLLDDLLAHAVSTARPQRFSPRFPNQFAKLNWYLSPQDMFLREYL